MSLTLVLLAALLTGEPTGGASGPVWGPAPLPPPPQPSRFVFVGTAEPRFFLVPPHGIPTLAGSFFFGRRLDTAGRRVKSLAVGYQLEPVLDIHAPTFALRHHVMAVGSGPRSLRLFWAAGAGLGHMLPALLHVDAVARIGWAPQPGVHMGLILGVNVLVATPVVRGGVPPLVTAGPFIGGALL